MTLTPTGVRMPVDSMSMRALIGMVQALETPGNCSDLSISWIRPSTVRPGRHSLLGLEVDDGLEHLDRRRVGGGLSPARLAVDGRHLGERADDAVLGLQQLGRLGHRQPRQGGRHVEQRALVEVGHELGADARHRPHRDAQERPAQARWSASWPAARRRMTGR